MSITEILDHLDRAKDRLPGFMRGATNFELFLDALVAETQNLETVFFQLLDERHLTVAVGAQLNGIGQIVDLERIVGETDSAYRTRLIARAGELAKGGEIETLITAFINLTGLTSPDELKLTEVYPASIIMEWLTDDPDPEDPSADAELVSAMNAIRAAGVRLDMTRSTISDSFMFSDVSEVVGGDGPIDSEHGFGRIITYDATMYGYSSGGNDGAYTDIVDKFPFATDANAADVGDLTVLRGYSAGQSSSTYGYTSGGWTGTYSDVIDKFPFASDTNATDVGNLTQSRGYASGQQSGTYGYSSGGLWLSYVNIIDKFTFASDANATDVGDLTIGRNKAAGQSSLDYGYCSGGSTPTLSNIIDKFTFASDANATDVGDLSVTRSNPAGQSSTDYGYTSGGFTGAQSNVIDKFTFASDANATDVGDLTVARQGAAGHQY